MESRKTGLSKDSKAQCHQIRTISKLRITSSVPMGVVNNDIIKRVENALKLHLDLI
jgi:mRNA interferase MazF